MVLVFTTNYVSRVSRNTDIFFTISV